MQQPPNLVDEHVDCAACNSAEAGASLKQRMQPKHRGTVKCTLLDCVALSLASLGLLLAALSLSRDEPPSEQEQPHVANYSGDSAVLETYKWLQDVSSATATKSTC